ncbi:CtsR family transcriptional regulator [Dethiobacter alkaliphilus]|nr:CtsR family transcriptional regulator [Dethiobacter alkaliphilus]
MSNLANNIESYLKRLLDASPNAAIIIQRKELAARFQCVPSQINYVLSTRFTSERGFVVESRRGGGGYLQIRRIDLDRAKVSRLLEILREMPGESFSAQDADDFISRLMEARLVTRREGLLMKAVTVHDRGDGELFQSLRTLMLTRMLEVLLRES